MSLKPQVGLHLQRGEPDVDAVDERGDVAEAQERNEPQRRLPDDVVFVHERVHRMPQPSAPAALAPAECGTSVPGCGVVTISAAVRSGMRIVGMEGEWNKNTSGHQAGACCRAAYRLTGGATLRPQR